MSNFKNKIGDHLIKLFEKDVKFSIRVLLKKEDYKRFNKLLDKCNKLYNDLPSDDKNIYKELSKTKIELDELFSSFIKDGNISS